MLNVDYIVSGSVRRQGQRLAVMVELVETRTARIVWAETFDHKFDDAFLVLDEIGDRIVASIANEIETSERNRAVLKPPNSLDAWEAHHRGPVAHVSVQQIRQRAGPSISSRWRCGSIPTFARAYAGLSFTHFQNAFQGWAEARAGNRPGFRRGWAKPDGRRSRSGRALGDGPSAVAARPPRPVHHRAGAGHRPEPEFRARPLHARLRPFAGWRSTRRHCVFGPSRAISAHSIRCCSPCLARAPWRWCASAGSRRPPIGASRPPPVRTRMRMSWRSRHYPWRSPAGSMRRAGYLAAIHKSAAALQHRRLPDRDAVRIGRREAVS